MSRFRMEQKQSQEMRQEMRQVLRMEQANLLELSEEDFHRLVRDIEASHLFQRLYRREKLVRYQRFAMTDLAAGFYDVREDAVAATGSLDVDSLLLNREQLVRKIQGLGAEKFKRYFLFPESGMSAEEIATACCLEVAEVRHINSLIDDFSVMSEFYHPSASPDGKVHYVKVARVEGGDGGFVIGYFSPALARGRYSVDYAKFEELKTSGTLNDSEIAEARQLFRKLELINSRKDTLNQVLQHVVVRQSLYLESGNLKSLLPFSQKELAGKIGIAASSVSRAVRGRSIEAPWGQEVPLKNFFPRPRSFRRELVRQLLEGARFSSDDEVRMALLQKFGVAVSRRTVASIRKELKVPSLH